MVSFNHLKFSLKQRLSILEKKEMYQKIAYGFGLEPVCKFVLFQHHFDLLNLPNHMSL